MDAQTVERYRAARAPRWPYSPMGARRALRVARTNGDNGAGPWDDEELHPDSRAEWEQEGFTLRASVEYDTHGGFPDYLGTIYNRERDIPWEDRHAARRIEYRSRVSRGNHGTVWLVPMEGYEAQREYYRTESKIGNAAAHLRAAWSETQTVDRARAWLEDEWYHIGLRVQAYRAGVELGAGSIWSVESDGGHDYFNEITRDAATEAITEARAALAALCGGGTDA